MATLAYLDIFKREMGLEPSETQTLMSVMVLPWSPKLIYGIVADTFPICKSRKKSYITLMGLIQCICALAIPLMPFQDIYLMCAMGTMMAFASAFMDVIVDGLMVCQARNDPENGSEELQTYSWAMVGIGGVVGGILGGELVEIGQSMIVFYILAGVGLAISVSGCMMSRKIEKSSDKVINMGLCQRTKMNLVEIKKGFQIRELYKSVVFFILLGAVIPSFADYMYYYELDVAGFTEFQYATLGIVASLCLFVGTIAYDLFLKDKGIRFMMVVACLVNMVGAAFTLLFLRGIMFGMDPYWFMMASSSVTDVLYIAFVNMPGMVLFAKLIPANIESSMFALLTGLMNLSNLFLAKMLGNYINTYIGVTEDNLEDLWKLYAIQILCCMIPAFFICLLPSKMQVEQVQKALEFREKQDTMSDAQAANDLMKLDPNMALRMGLASKAASFAVPTNREIDSDSDEVDDDDVGAAIEEEEM